MQTVKLETRQKIGFRFSDLQSTRAAMYVVDGEGRILYFNPTMEDLFGYTSKEYLGKRISMLSTEPESTQKRISEALDEGSGSWQGEITVKAKDGSTFPCYITASRFTDDEGEVSLTMGMARDMSDYQETVEALKSRSDRLGALASLAGRIATYKDPRRLAREALQAASDLLQTSCGIIYLTDLHSGRLEKHEILNLPEGFFQNLDESDWEDFLESQVVKEKVPILIQDVADEPRISHVSRSIRSLALIPLISQERVIGVMMVSTAPPQTFDNADMEFLYAMGSQVGVYLENARLYQELEKSNRELKVQNTDLEELLSILSHDLRSPLATIGGYASLLMRKGDDSSPEERVQFARIIFRKTKETSNRLSDMLTFFKASLARPESSSERVDVRDVIAQSLEEAASEETMEETTVAIPDHLPILLGNRNQMIHLFTNLLSNAFKFRHPEGKLDITIKYDRLETETETLQRFSVSDNGIGISAKWYGNIFQLFNRGSAAQDIPGTGVGLAIVDRIVKKNHGTIDVTSKPGKGSSFTFTLPWPEVEEPET